LALRKLKVTVLRRGGTQTQLRMTARCRESKISSSRLTEHGEGVHEEKLHGVDVDDPRRGREYDRDHPTQIHLGSFAEERVGRGKEGLHVMVVLGKGSSKILKYEKMSCFTTSIVDFPHSSWISQVEYGVHRKPYMYVRRQASADRRKTAKLGRV